MRNVIAQPLLLLCDVSPSYKFKVFKCNFNLSVMPDDETGSLTIVRDSLFCGPESLMFDREVVLLSSKFDV
jgi:hypothetical protein